MLWSTSPPFDRHRYGYSSTGVWTSRSMPRLTIAVAWGRGHPLPLPGNRLCRTERLIRTLSFRTCEDVFCFSLSIGLSVIRIIFFSKKNQPVRFLEPKQASSGAPLDWMNKNPPAGWYERQPNRRIWWSRPKHQRRKAVGRDGRASVLACNLFVRKRASEWSTDFVLGKIAPCLPCMMDHDRSAPTTVLLHFALVFLCSFMCFNFPYDILV